MSPSHLWVTRLVNCRNHRSAVYRGDGGKAWELLFPSCWLSRHHRSNSTLPHRRLLMLTAARIPTWHVPKGVMCLLEARSTLQQGWEVPGPLKGETWWEVAMPVRKTGKLTQGLWDHGELWLLIVLLPCQLRLPSCIIPAMMSWSDEADETLGRARPSLDFQTQSKSAFLSYPASGALLLYQKIG